MEDFNVWSYLVQVAPVVVVMAIGFKYLFQLYKEKDADYKGLQAEFRQSESENLEVLRDLSTVLDTLLKENEDANETIVKAIETLGDRLEKYIQERIKTLRRHGDYYDDSQR